MDLDPENSQGQGRQIFGGLGGVLPMNFGPRPPRPKETIGTGGFNPDFPAELSPSTFGKKGRFDPCFHPKSPKRALGNLG